MKDLLSKLLNFVLLRQVARDAGADAKTANTTAAIQVLAKEDEKK